MSGEGRQLSGLGDHLLLAKSLTSANVAMDAWWTLDGVFDAATAVRHAARLLLLVPGVGPATLSVALCVAVAG